MWGFHSQENRKVVPSHPLPGIPEAGLLERALALRCYAGEMRERSSLGLYPRLLVSSPPYLSRLRTQPIEDEALRATEIPQGW